jgi:hypothetical protein
MFFDKCYADPLLLSPYDWSVQLRHFQSNVSFAFAGGDTAEATNPAIIKWQWLGPKEPQ